MTSKNLNKKVTSNKTKHVLVENESKGQQDKTEKLQSYDSSLFIDQGYIFNDGSQNFLILKPIFKTFTTPVGFRHAIVEGKSKGVSNEKIKPPITANYSHSQKPMRVNNSEISVRFTESCWKQDKVIFYPMNVVNLLIVYELDPWSRDFVLTLKDYSFGAVKLNKNDDPDKYSGYGIGFDFRWLFTILNFYDKSFVIFGVENRSSVHFENKKKRYLSCYKKDILESGKEKCLKSSL